VLLNRHICYISFTLLLGTSEYFDLILIFRPGLQDPTFVPVNVSEDLIRGLDSQVANSIAVLTRVVAGTAVPTVPVFDTFVMLTEDSTDARQNWDKSVQISAVEFLCQVGESVISMLYVPSIKYEV
jgi:hypothetical protein